MAKAKVTAATILGRVTYTSTYAFLCAVLAVLLLLVPADIVRQVLGRTHQRTNVLVVVIAYVLALLIVLFVYALRLYTGRTMLASIPRARIPVEKGDVGKPVRAMIVASLGRSAAIAWEARPKPMAAPPAPSAGGGLDTIVEGPGDASDDGELPGGRARNPERRGILGCCSGLRRRRQQKPKNPAAKAEDHMCIALPPVRPVWGHVEHDGWESPDAPDLPNLQYATVLAELPNLVEAKAVSLAPPDRGAPVPAALDPDAVALLQRAPHMAMRDYVGHLVSLGMLPPPPPPGAEADGDGESQQPPPRVVSEFLDAYERARFSTRPASKVLFRNLMHLFAELLRAMRPPDPSGLYGDDDDDSGWSEDGRYPSKLYGGGGGDGASLSESSDGRHIDDDAPRDGTPTTPTRSLSFSGSLLSSLGAARSRNSVRSTASSMRSQQQQQPQSPLYPPQLLRPTTSSHRDRNSSSTNTWQRYRTAPTTPLTPASRRLGGGGAAAGHDPRLRRTESSSSASTSDAFARTRRPFFPASSSSGSSRSGSSHGSASLRSFASVRVTRPATGASGVSRASSSGASQQGSVIIRLARPEDGESARGLPYVLRVGSDER